MKKTLFLFAAILLQCAVHSQIITTIAGNGDYGFNADNIPATDASFAAPMGVCTDASGNIYISTPVPDYRIRKVNTSGIITTVAGTGVNGSTGDGGPATDAQIRFPRGITTDNLGNLYICDNYLSKIRKVNTSGIITTVAGTGVNGYSGDGGPATNAQIAEPYAVCVDNDGNIYISDGNKRIRKVNSSGIISTIAGTGVTGFSGDGGPATNAQISTPTGIATSKGDIYFCDGNNKRVRKIDRFGYISTVAGSGGSSVTGDGIPATDATFKAVNALLVDATGSMYITDIGSNTIRKVDASGIISTISGSGNIGFSGDGGPATAAELNAPVALAFDGSGGIYVADFGNRRIRHITSIVSVNEYGMRQNNVSVYPNPNNGKFTIDISAAVNNKATILITDISGKLVKEVSVVTHSPALIDLDAPLGVYFYKVISGNNVWVGSLQISP